ncbi:MAG: hypothetical protein EON52_11235 [Actinomycetales bacterium]|nr:MAG: hypothetical protein EON52_11235 [Actinomycetales bacterium]
MSNDLHGLLAPYALDALDADERSGFESHLDQCETCQAELPGLVETLSRVGESESATPPPALRSSVLAAVSTMPQQRPVVSLDSRRRLRRTLPQLVAAAAVVAAMVGGGFAAIEHDNVSDMRADQERVTAIISAADATTTSGNVSTGGTLRVISSKSHSAAVVSGSSLKELPGDKVYQLWTMHHGIPKDAGLLGTKDGMVYVPKLGDAVAVAVTVEPQGGSKEPTGEPVAVTDLAT